MTVGIADLGDANAQRGQGALFTPEKLIFRRKKRFPAVFAPGNLLGFGKNW